MKAKSYTLLYIIGSVWTLLLAVSCNDNRVYDHYEHTQLKGWERNDTLTFNIPPVSKGTYQLNIGIRANQDYPFKTISIVMSRKTMPKGIIKNDTIRCKIIEDNGKLAGQNGISSTELRYHVRDLELNQGDSLHITLNHCMRREILPGLSEIGLQLVK